MLRTIRRVVVVAALAGTGIGLAPAPDAAAYCLQPAVVVDDPGNTLGALPGGNPFDGRCLNQCPPGSVCPMAAPDSDLRSGR